MSVSRHSLAGEGRVEKRRLPETDGLGDGW